MPETAAPRIIKQSRATAPQREFWASTARYRCMSGGVGSGKSYAGVVEAIRQPKGTTGMVLAPTYPMLRDSTLQAFLGVVQRAGILVSFNSGTMTAKLKGSRTVLFRTADKPDRLRGPNLSWFWIDEAAMVSPQTWSIMIGRLRVHPGVAWITTTPRGKNWVYKTFVEGGADYKLVKAPTRTNTFLPGHFVDSLLANYDTHFAQQEVDGEFLDDATGKLVPDHWLERMVTCDPVAHRSPRELAIAVDLAAGNGGDKTVVMLGHRHGLLGVESGDNLGPQRAAALVAGLVREHGVPHDRIVYDRGGVLLAEQFERELHVHGIRHAVGYTGSESGGEEHANLRSWAFFNLRSWLTPDLPTDVRDVPPDPWYVGPERRDVKYQAPFSVPRPIPDWWPALKEELAALRFEMRLKKLALQPKDQLQAAIKRSPDYADALAMFCWLLSPGPR